MDRYLLSLAPLLRGEGGVRGSFFYFSRVISPLTRIADGDPTSTRKRGEVNQASASIQFKTIMLQPFNARRIAIGFLIWKIGLKIKRDQAASDRRSFGGDFAGSPL